VFFSTDDNPTNSLALFKLCHWTVEYRLADFVDNYRVIDVRSIAYNIKIPLNINQLANRSMILPERQRYYPVPEI
jgi:putative restriction endonuclease